MGLATMTAHDMIDFNKHQTKAIRKRIRCILRKYKIKSIFNDRTDKKEN